MLIMKSVKSRMKVILNLLHENQTDYKNNCCKWNLIQKKCGSNKGCTLHTHCKSTTAIKNTSLNTILNQLRH